MKFNFLEKIKEITNFNITGWFNFNRFSIWKGILIFFMILTFFIFLFSFYLYFQIERNNIFLVEDTPETKKEITEINKNYLFEIIKEFDNKSNELERLKEEKSFDIIDPSL